MKFKEFVVNSLPRVRSRKKKNLAQKTRSSELYDKNRNRCGPKITWERAFGSFSSDEDNHQPDEAPRSNYSLEEAVKTACGQIIDTFRYQDNSSFSDRYHLSHEFGVDFIQQQNTLLLCSDEHKDLNSVPKTRSRIRTNPWIPSPKSSTTSSASCSACSSTSTSPALSPSNKCNSYNSKSSLILPGLNSVLPFHDKISKCSCQFFVDVNTKQMNNLNCGVTSTCTCDTDDSSDLSPHVDMCSQFELHHNISFEYEESLECSLEDNLVKRDVSIEDLLTEDDVLRDAAVQTDFLDENEESASWPFQADMGTELIEYSSCPDCMQESTDTGYSSLGRDGQLEVDDDFQFYAVDQKCDGSSHLNVSSNGSTVLYSIVPEEKNVRCSHYENNITTVKGDNDVLPTSDVISPTSDVISATDDVIPYNYDVISRYVDIISPIDVISPTDDVISPTDILSEGTCKAETGRTLLQVKSSLHEKVCRLRLEKQIVEDKIREAQEEERIIEQQRYRFQHLLSFHKKEILLNTLHHLTERLEDQGNRLQASYSIILSMQQRFAKRQGQTPVVTRAAT